MRNPAESFANAKAHPVLHEWLKWYHDSCDGIAIFAAGNFGLYDPSPYCPYLIMCSGIDRRYQLSSISNYGMPIWFTGPAEGIYCSDRQGRVVATNGTSCVAPMIAGLFALGMSRYPSYSNKSLESLMIMSCQKNRERRDKIGYGMPNAEILVSGYCPRGGEEETNNEKPAPPPEGAEFNITPVDPAAIQCDDTPPPAVPSSVDKPTTENQLVAPATR